MPTEFDPIAYGVLMEKVNANEIKIDAMTNQINGMERDIKSLLLLAERSKGSLFALMGVSSVVSGAFGLLIDWVKK
jgi:hypothetical protein